MRDDGEEEVKEEEVVVLGRWTRTDGHGYFLFLPQKSTPLIRLIRARTTLLSLLFKFLDQKIL